MSEAFALLARVGAPAAAVVALAASPLPQLGPRLASGLLRFLAAAPEPEALARWLATLREPLERAGQSELFSRLQQEIGQIARPGEGGDWRALALPLQGESGLLPAMLYLRRQPRDGAATGERGEAGTRFVLEVELSRLGALQLDGLVRPRRFDLMLRSHKPLTAEMERDIAAIFDEARAIGRFAGSLAFATVASFPIRPLEEIGRPGGGVMV